MKNIIYRITVAACCAIMLAGCNFLEERSNDEMIPRTAEDLSELLAGRGYPWGNESSMLSYVYALCDNVQSFHTVAPAVTGIAGYQNFYSAFTWQPDMYEVDVKATGMSNGSSYNTYYLRIGGCNAVIDLIDDSIGDRAMKDIVKARALTLRAMHYFFLVNLYGKPYNVDKASPGVPLKLAMGVDPDPIPRNTVEEVYDQIVADLLQAIELFEKHGITRNDFHVNLPAAYILLSRTYLFMERWEECVAAATKAIQLGRGLGDMTGLTAWMPIATYNFPETEWLYGRAEYTLVMNQLYFVPSEELLAMYGTGDTRRNAFFKRQTATIGGQSYGADICFKFDNLTSASLGNSIRMGEAYLNRAEAYARLNDAKATADINELRSKRIAGYVPVASVTLEDVLAERRKELCFELPRWFDLRRTGMPSITRAWGSGTTTEMYTLRQNDPMYTLPIPPEAITANKALEQNESRLSGTRNPGV
ncbi:MAG: RagB/SusD family nutrient uptake outer membrane protein [Rikenellaceae bacterium]|nr:RagB/SusD family nutrient uptake outer membrane protein [Rikenellaceae bacterium]MCL2693207.1 RagB/SusD family nutrient uptake outer membrane protein [Rikenellaceae bacterium]